MDNNHHLNEIIEREEKRGKKEKGEGKKGKTGLSSLTSESCGKSNNSHKLDRKCHHVKRMPPVWDTPRVHAVKGVSQLKVVQY